jgi:DNA-binding transcriptional LysR family regulator
MKLRHLRYFLAVAEASNFTKAAAQLQIAQPALSRQVKHLEDEIGVELLRRSPRGVTLTAEGRLFQKEVRELLKRTGESVENVRALARGEYGQLRIGYVSAATIEILPPGLAAFRKSVPGAEVMLYDLSSDELITGLRKGRLELAIMVQPISEQTPGIQAEVLRTYPLCVALTPAHPFASLKSIPLEKVAAQPLIGLRAGDFPEYHRNLSCIFASIGAKPSIVVECDSNNSLLIEVEAGRGITLCIPIFKLVTGKRLLYRPVTGTTVSVSIAIAHAAEGELTPAAEKFCDIMRQTSAARNAQAARASEPLDTFLAVDGTGDTVML